MPKCRIQLPIPRRFVDHLQQEARYNRVTINEAKFAVSWLMKQPLVDSEGWFKKLPEGAFLVGRGPSPFSILKKGSKPYNDDIEILENKNLTNHIVDLTKKLFSNLK